MQFSSSQMVANLRQLLLLATKFEQYTLAGKLKTTQKTIIRLMDVFHSISPEGFNVRIKLNSKLSLYVARFYEIVQHDMIL